MTDSESYQVLQQINQQIAAVIKQIANFFQDDFEKSEELAITLQESIGQRQKLLAAWLPTTTADDIDQLNAEKTLSEQFEQCIASFKQRYANELATRKSNTQKVNLYKTLDAKGR